MTLLKVLVIPWCGSVETCTLVFITSNGCVITEAMSPDPNPQVRTYAMLRWLLLELVETVKNERKGSIMDPSHSMSLQWIK